MAERVGFASPLRRAYGAKEQSPRRSKYSAGAEHGGERGICEPATPLIRRKGTKSQALEIFCRGRTWRRGWDLRARYAAHTAQRNKVPGARNILQGQNMAESVEFASPLRHSYGVKEQSPRRSKYSAGAEHGGEGGICEPATPRIRRKGTKSQALEIFCRG